MARFLSAKTQTQVDRALYDRALSHAIAADLPSFYSRLREIAMEGEDSDSLRSILALFDRFLGKPEDQSEKPKQALTINIVNALGGSLSDYKVTRYGKTLGDDGEPVLDDHSPSHATVATPGISSLPPTPE